MFLLDEASRIRQAVQIPVILLGGLVSRDDLEQAMARGFDFVALGRALLADRDFVQRLDRKEIERSRCTACNGCVAAMQDGGVRCVLDDEPRSEVVR
jgi:2,4-dienoyl-CoA reductase-like NADH-dependent reductase (Old Yellow Enzyme family)